MLCIYNEPYYANEQEFAQFKTQWEYQDLRMRHHPQSIRSNFLNAMGYRISSRLRKNG